MRGSGLSAVWLVGLALLPALAADPESAALRPRLPLPKPAAIERPDYPSRLVVKFLDELRVRPTSQGAIESLAARDLAAVSELAQTYDLTFTPLIQLPQDKLTRLEQRAAARSGRAQPDLGAMLVASAPDARLEEAARALLGLAVVEWVEFEQLNPPPPCNDIPPVTPHYFAQGLENHHEPPMGGLDVPYAWAAGARGQGVSIADCEYGYIAGTEDLCGVIDEPGQTSTSFKDHGTAVLGVMVGLDNAYGVTGMVPEATALFFPELTVEQGSRRVTAITNAIATVDAGDIVVLEMQATGAGGGYGPAELWLSVWTVVRAGTDAGVIVIGAAGNGNQNLDSSAYAPYRSWGDSGAILVGAGTSDTLHQKISFSTYGSRVNLQGWGANVFTLGYGAYATLGGDERQRYTSSFSGTSSATPIVASAAAAVQSLALSTDGCTYGPEALRQLLIDTGIPQGGSGGHIGPFPDLAAAIDTVLEGRGTCTYGCGNDFREGAEACDGTDTGACEGLCAEDCTCLAFGPGAVEGLQVTGYLPAIDRMTIAWDPACLSTDHSLVYGPLDAVASYGYTGQLCGLGVTGSYSPVLLGPGSFFFLVVGRDTDVEGSYGTSSSGTERPEHAGDLDCDPLQDLAQPCN